MKNLTLIILAFVLLGNLYSQENKFELKLTGIERYDNYYTESFTYDSSYLMVENKVDYSDGDLYIDSLYYFDGKLAVLESYNNYYGYWINSYYKGYTYDAAGNRVDTYSYNIHRLNGMAFDVRRYEYFYENGKRIAWNGVFEYGYDEEGFIYYDDEGRMIEKIAGDVIDIDSFRYSWRVVYDYDSLGRMILVSNFDWKEGEWEEYLKDELFYDQLGNCIERKRYTDGEYSYHYRYVYDLDYEIEEIVMPFVQEDDEIPFYWVGYVNKLDTVFQYRYDADTDELNFVNYLAYQYELTDTTDDDDDDDDGKGNEDDEIDELPDGFVVFPNPAGNKITILYKDTELQSITIFDITGKLVLEYSADNLDKAELDISLLAPGIYVIQAKTSEGTVKRKVVVE